MATRKLSMLVDAFTAPVVNTVLWNNVTAGAATLDAVNDEVLLAVPTASGGVNVFSTSTLYDATGSYAYAQIGVAANGAGTTKTIMRVRYDIDNAVSMRVEAGAFKMTMQIGGVLTSTTLPSYDPHAHRWWRLREAGGVFYADTAPDGLTWTQQASMAYTWDASNITLRFEAQAGAAETAGNVSVIAHVNTRDGGPFNPNWPGIEDAWAPFWNANAGTFPIDRYVEISDRTRGSMSVQRGRQYETDQVRSGEASLRLANDDGALDPVNASSPWAGHIAPYQPYRRRAQWPVSRNLLDQVIATGGDLGPYSLGNIDTTSAGPDIFSTTDTSGGSFVASSTAWSGGTVMQFAVPAGSAAGALPVHTPRWSVVPGRTYTMQLRVRNITAATSLSVQPFFGWYVAGAGFSPTSYTYGGSATLTGAATDWTNLTLTVTAPTNVSGMSVGVALAANAAAAVTLQSDGWQLEKGTAATAWTCPGTWWPVYAGWMERWPSSWDMNGLYGMVEPNAVDTFALLSQQQLSDALTMELNANSPRFVYKLDEPAGSTTAADWTGNNSPVQIGIGKYGAGSITFGAAIAANDGAAGIYTGSSGTVATVNNSNPGTNLISGGASFLKLTSAGIKGPADPTLWTRMIAFRYTGPTPTHAAHMWSAMDTQRANGIPSGSHLYIYLYSDGKPVISLQGPTGTNAFYYFHAATNCADGDWHLLIFGYNQATGQLFTSQDGSYNALSGFASTLTPTGIAGDNLGGFVDITVGNGTTFNFKGDISFAAEFPTFLSSTAVSNLYEAWRSACAGESTDARYARILRYAGFNGVTHLSGGMTTSMGPATFDGQDAMSALQGAVDTENGAHFVDAGGGIQFKSRAARYNALTPAYIFGERTELGEWPYEEVTLDYDSTHLSNQVTVTQEGSSQQFYAVDDTSVAAYFPRTMTRSINASSTDECNDAAAYLLSRYRQPATRVSTLKLHPAANPALWPVCLALELGTRVRVMRRPPNAPASQVECFVENLQWEFDSDNDAWLTLQCSPADLTPYGVFAAWHTTLNTTAAAGATSVTVRAPADNTNVLSQQIAPGQQLVLGQGTANTETVTVKSVGTTSSGWTTGVLTLTAATTKAHTANDTVCEPLPSGTTDPATWDTVARFDSIAFAY
ncbi:hypothetical protein [Streptomyces sp. YIM S03343]